MSAPMVTSRKSTNVLLWCGAIGGPLFVVAFLIEGATRADYDPLRHPVSSLALGPFGWTQIANFIVTGLLTLAFAVGLYRALRARGQRSIWGPLLIAIWAIGLLGAGVFVTDPISGYPPGSPPLPDPGSVHGSLHDLFSVPAFIALPAACFVFARRFAGWGQRGWATYSVASGLLFLLSFVLASLGFAQIEGFVEIGGLLQRLTVVIGLSWLTLLAIRTLVAVTAASPGRSNW